MANLRVSGLVLGLPLQFCAADGPKRQLLSCALMLLLQAWRGPGSSRKRQRQSLNKAPEHQDDPKRQRESPNEGAPNRRFSAAPIAIRAPDGPKRQRESQNHLRTEPRRWPRSRGFGPRSGSRCSFARLPADGPKRQREQISTFEANLRVSGLVLGPVAVLRACRQTGQNGNGSKSALLGRICVFRASFWVPLQFCALAGRRAKTATGELERGCRAPNQRFSAPSPSVRVRFSALAGRRPETATGEPENQISTFGWLPWRIRVFQHFWGGESACFGPRSGPPLQFCVLAGRRRAGRRRAGRRPETATGERERGSRAPNQHGP